MVQTYRLAITHIEQTCLFDLTWGEGMQLTAEVPYPQELMRLHRQWQQDYYRYYQNFSIPDGTQALRGRVGVSGEARLESLDLRRELAEVEVRLLNTFHRWLESHELRRIRDRLRARSDQGHHTTVFLTCSTADLRRLPWETWELTGEFGQGPSMSLARLPVNIPVAANPPRKKRRRARALVIIGDDTGLDFEDDLEAIKQVSRLVDTEVIGYRPGRDPHGLVDDIRDRIRDPDGWDMLFFFGHSNEAAELGGEIAIAPNMAISIHDLDADLNLAKRNGLQFALFNSCDGLDIAQRLVALGLNQVVIMREPIHNQVAQFFLLQFLQRLAQFDNVHQALHQATKALKAEKNIAYPSAYLVPSLYRHRGAALFRLEPVGWRAKLGALLPTRQQGLALGAIAMLSLLPPVRDTLMAGRLWTQAVYRQTTSRPLQAAVDPPVILVHVDKESIARGIPDGKPNPLNRVYLASLLDRVVALDAQVIGIDYLLDRRQDDNDASLKASIDNAISQERWLVFASELDKGRENKPRSELVNPAGAMSGYTNAHPWTLNALQLGQSCLRQCPFSYLLTMAQATQSSADPLALSPALTRASDLRQDFLSATTGDGSPSVQALFHYRLSPIFSLSRWIEQRWLQPALDFSIPPGHVYDRIPAHELLDTNLSTLRTQYDWQNKIILIGAGGYSEAGVDDYQDAWPTPPATQFWRNQTEDSNEVMTGVELQAYTIHHFLKSHITTPTPILWGVGVGAMAGAGSALLLKRQKRLRPYRWLGLAGVSLGYGLVGIVMHSTTLIVLPWLLPTVAMWVYHIPSQRRLS